MLPLSDHHVVDWRVQKVVCRAHMGCMAQFAALHAIVVVDERATVGAPDRAAGAAEEAVELSRAVKAKGQKVTGARMVEGAYRHDQSLAGLQCRIPASIAVAVEVVVKT